MSKRTKLGAISPFFVVDELKGSVAYYRDILGFDVRLLFPEEDPFFAIVGRDDAQILLKMIAPGVHPQPSPSRHPWPSWDAFVYVDEPDELASELDERGAAFHEKVRDWEDGLRGFEIADCDGYVIFFGCPMSDARAFTADRGPQVSA